MFSWLEEELGTIKDRKFHLIGEQAARYFSQESEKMDWPVPPPKEYQVFLERFGPAALYRVATNIWALKFFERPIIEKDERDTVFLVFGFWESYSLAFPLERLKRKGIHLYMSNAWIQVGLGGSDAFRNGLQAGLL